MDCSRSLLAAVTLSLLGFSCGGDGGEAQPELCDGQASPRLVYRLSGGGLGRPPPESVHFENGTYLVVDGQCRYFANYTEDGHVWPVVRTGVLSHDDLAELLRRLRILQWPTLVRVDGVDPTRLFHRAISVWSDGKNFVGCLDDCSGPMKSISDESQKAIARLWKAGKAYDGPMRISMVAVRPLPRADVLPANAVAWPLKVDIDSAVIPMSGTYPDGGLGMLVDDTQDVAVLRTIRDRFYSGAVGIWYYHFQFIPIKRAATDTSYDFDLQVRDAIPYEDEKGAIPTRW